MSEEQKKAGRPRKYERPVVRTSIRVPKDVYDWLNERGISPTVVKLVRQAIQQEQKP